MTNDQATYVIASYRPHEGKQEELLDIIREHGPTLRAEGLITDAPVLVLQAADGTYLEIFEWASGEASAKAHTNEKVGVLWGRFMEVAEMATLSSLQEAQRPFAPFAKVTL